MSPLIFLELDCINTETQAIETSLINVSNIVSVFMLHGKRNRCQAFFGNNTYLELAYSIEEFKHVLERWTVDARTD